MITEKSTKYDGMMKRGVLGGLALWAPPVQCGRLWILLQNSF
jgi:hypothetical protein